MFALVERYLSSEVHLFFELRVRYLLACERTQEAMALSQRCSQHPTAGRHMYFKQAYLVCLWKTAQQERLFTEVSWCSGSPVSCQFACRRNVAICWSAFLCWVVFYPPEKMAEIDGKEAVEILCIAELEEKDNLLLELSRGFLLQQLRSGDTYHIWWVSESSST